MISFYFLFGTKVRRLSDSDRFLSIFICFSYNFQWLITPHFRGPNIQAFGQNVTPRRTKSISKNQIFSLTEMPVHDQKPNDKKNDFLKTPKHPRNSRWVISFYLLFVGFIICSSFFVDFYVLLLASYKLHSFKTDS